MNKVRISTEIENIRKYQRDITELKNTVTNLKYAPERFKSTLNVNLGQWNSPNQSIPKRTKKE